MGVCRVRVFYVDAVHHIVLAEQLDQDFAWQMERGVTFAGLPVEAINQPRATNPDGTLRKDLWAFFIPGRDVGHFVKGDQVTVDY